MNTPINGTDLIALGYAENAVLGIALRINRGRNGFTKEQMLANYAAVLAQPENYISDKIFSKLNHLQFSTNSKHKTSSLLMPLPIPLFFQTFNIPGKSCPT
jgi:tRNA-splicing ligase RtcB